MAFMKIKFRLSGGEVVGYYVPYRKDLEKFRQNQWQIRDYIPFALSRIQRRYYAADEYARVSGLIPVLDSLTEESVVNLARVAEQLMSDAWLIRVIPKRGCAEWHKFRLIKIKLSGIAPESLIKGLDSLMEMARNVKTPESFSHIVHRRQVWEREYNISTW